MPANTGERLRRMARRALPHGVYLALGESLNLYFCLRKLGLRNTARLLAARIGGGRRQPALIELDVPGFAYPVALRPNTSDTMEFIHTIVRDGYGRCMPAPPVRRIVDAGANIGDTTVWYLNRFPDAQVVAIEPDPENFEMLRRNTRHYGDRVIAKHSGLWSAEGTLAASGAGGYSGRAVRPAGRFDAAAVPALTVPRLMEEMGWDAIDILKCDIEGAELQVFAGPCHWLDRVRVLYIETHGAEAERQVLATVRAHDFQCRTYRELLICSRPGAPG